MKDRYEIIEDKIHNIKLLQKNIDFKENIIPLIC